MTRPGRFAWGMLVLFLLAGQASSYTYKGNSARPVIPRDPEYDSFTAKFPGYSRVISSLYPEYSGWIIPLAERYGIAPLLAVSGHDDPEKALPFLWRDADIFTEIFDALGGLSLPETARAVTALEILAAFSVRDSGTEAAYSREVQSVKRKDSLTGFTGRKANYYARQIPASSSMPGNFLHDLKANHPAEYSRLIHELSRADYDTLKAIRDYPDASAFLLKTGSKGAYLVPKTGGNIAALSWLLTEDEQAGLPETFRKYPGLSEALRLCGFESFFTVMICPELFFMLSEHIGGTQEERFTLSYAFILSQAEAGNAEFLAELSPSGSLRLSRYVADMMNTPGCQSVPLNEPMISRFLMSCGDDAADICRDYGAFVDVADLFVNGWDCCRRDVHPVIEAVKNFGVMGLQAALRFRDMKRTQGLILGHRNAARRSELLMFMLYDEASGHKFTERIGNIEEGAEFMLDNYKAHPKTGEPVPVKDGDGLWEYVPYHGTTATLYNWWKYGKTPSLSEAVEAGFDLVSFVNITQSATKAVSAVAKGVAKGNARKVLVGLAKNAIKSSLDDLPGDIIGGYIYRHITSKAASVNIRVSDILSPDITSYTGRNTSYPPRAKPGTVPSIPAKRGITSAGKTALMNHLSSK